MKFYCLGAGTLKPTVPMGVFSGLDVFVSYMDMKAHELIALRRTRPATVICDSGAHGYFSAFGSAIKSASSIKLSKAVPPPKKYVEKYARFIAETLHVVDCFVELDTVQMHGPKFQKWQRACLLEACHGDRARLMPVYHSCEPRRAVFKLIDEFSYIGVEGQKTKDLSLDDYLNIVRPAYEH